jgi:quinolinate synthase
MKTITIDKVLHSLKKQVYEVKVSPSIATKAKVAIDRMMELN